VDDANEGKTNVEYARERSFMAAERTLMAWIRTALSMITFGFTIIKSFQYLLPQNAAGQVQPHGPRNLGILLIGIATFALPVATFQYWRYRRTLIADKHPIRGWDLTLFVGILVWLLGAFAILNVLFRLGPL
jgi:putative membrane protein